MGGKTSLPFLGGQDDMVVPGLWYLVYLVRDILFLFGRDFVSLYARTLYVSATNHGRIFIE